MIVKALALQMWFVKIKLRVMLGVLLVIGQNVSAEQQITAEWVETQLKPAGSLRTYAGKVVFEDSLKALKVKADSAFVQGATYVFVKDLLFADSTRTIQAKRLTYDNKKRVATFEGNVFLKEGQRSLFAQQIQVWPDSARVVAQDQVVFNFSDGKRNIHAHKLRYGATKNGGIAVGNVVAKINNEMDSLLIQTDSLRFNTVAKAYDFWGNVVVSQMGMALSAHWGQYAENVLKTVGQPHLVWVQRAMSDSVWAEADTIDAFLQNEVLDTLYLTSNAKIRLSTRRDTSIATYTLVGDRARIDVVAQNISKINMLGSVKLVFEHWETFAELPGDSVTVWFRDDMLDSIRIVGEEEGRVRVKDKGNSRLLGQSKILWFEDDRLVRMRLDGHAVCQYTSQDKSEVGDVDVSGDILDLFFQSGELSRINANGHVKGIYLQGNEVKSP